MRTDEIATRYDIETLQSELQEMKGLIKELIEKKKDRIYSVHELSKMKWIGGYEKIQNLISKNMLKTTPDGKVTEAAINEYLNLK